MTKSGVLEVHGLKFHYDYVFGNYAVYDCPIPFRGWEPSIDEFEAKAIATIEKQIAQEPFEFEHFPHTGIH